MISALRAFFLEKGVKVKNVSTSLSGNAVIVRYVKFPRLTKLELLSTLATEAEPFIPFDINEVQLGFHILSEIVEDGQKKMETVLVAAKRELIVSRLEILQGAGLTPTIIDVDSFAIENIHEKMRDAKEALGATLYLNIGHVVTNLSIVENGVTRVVRDMFVSGSTMTKAIMKAFSATRPRPRSSSIRAACSLTLQRRRRRSPTAIATASACRRPSARSRDLVSEVHRSVDFYLSGARTARSAASCSPAAPRVLRISTSTLRRS